MQKYRNLYRLTHTGVWIDAHSIAWASTPEGAKAAMHAHWIDYYNGGVLKEEELYTVEQIEGVRIESDSDGAEIIFNGDY